MLIACGFCGADITDGDDCGCRRTIVCPPRSHPHDVARAAVELSGVAETTLAHVARVLAEETS